MKRKVRPPPRPKERRAKSASVAAEPSISTQGPHEGTPISADTTYIGRFFVTQCPTTLGYVARMRGLAAPRPTDPFTYCDLGCGTGSTVNVLAAAMPQARFYGIDLSPDHIAIAERMAATGRLTNTTFIEGGFDSLLSREGLPDFDFVTLHGIYSWVDRATRRDILRVAKRILKPNGLLYLSYNALPGWAPLLPVRQALRVLAEQAVGTPDERAWAAILQMRKLAESAPYFATNPEARRLFEEILKERRDYIIHEFFSAAWDPFPFDEVAKEMASIGLNYCGSALLEPNTGDGGLAPELRPAARAVEDPIAAEAIRSFLRGEKYRADVFTAGHPSPGWLGRWEDFAGEIFGPPAGLVPTPEIRGGEFSELARDFLEITGTGRSSLAEIAETAPFAEHPKETLLRIAHAAARTHARRPYARRALDHAECPERIRPTLPIIRDLLAMAEREGRAPVPSPVLGTGTILPFATAFILEAACDFGVEGAVEPAVARVAASPKTWIQNGRHLKTAEEIRPAMTRQYEQFRKDWLPFLLRTGIVEPA